jgi:hypothetical protein
MDKALVQPPAAGTASILFIVYIERDDRTAGFYCRLQRSIVRKAQISSKPENDRSHRESAGNQ